MHRHTYSYLIRTIVYHDILIHPCFWHQHQHTITNPKQPAFPRYYTRARARAMEEENNAKFERMERAYQELQEKYSKTQNDISRMMEMLTVLIRGK